ncbi:MAG: hypothetical protein ACPH4D_06155, partial [Porticoccaceae bacterium]
MSKLEGPVILVGDNAVGLKQLTADFHAVGSKTLTAEDVGALDSVCDDPLSQLIVLLSKNSPIDNAEESAKLRQLCEDYLIVVALADADGDQIAGFFRHGVAD